MMVSYSGELLCTSLKILLKRLDLPSSPRDLYGRGSREIFKKEPKVACKCTEIAFFRQNRANAHINAETLTAFLRSAQAYTRGKWRKYSPHRQEYICNGKLLEKGRTIFFNGIIHQDRTQHKSHSIIFVCVLVCLFYKEKIICNCVARPWV